MGSDADPDLSERAEKILVAAASRTDRYSTLIRPRHIKRFELIPS